MSSPRVFISYSHDSPEHSERVLKLANTLRNIGIDAELDQYHVRPSQGWPAWCEEQLRPENADYVLVVCTSTYRERVENRTAADEGRGVFWEGQQLYSYIYEAKGNERFIPVLLPGGSEDDIPRPLKSTAIYRPTGFALTDADFESLYRDLTGQPAVVKPELGDVVSLSAREVLTSFVGSRAGAPRVDIKRIDKYAPERLIGRETETTLLDDSWQKVVDHETGRPHVLGFVALGGEGKTSLVAKWLAGMAGQDWPGCESVFAWSFYSQGSREQVAVSSDLFLAEALRFFGDPEMAGSAQERTRKVSGWRNSSAASDHREPTTTCRRSEQNATC